MYIKNLFILLCHNKLHMIEIKINLQILNTSFIIKNNKKIKLPFNEPLRHELQGFIYNLINDDSLHTKPYKGFTFTRLNGNGKKYVGVNKIIFNNDDCYFILSSNNDDIIDSIIENINFKQIYKIGDIFVNVKDIETINNEFTSEFYRVKTIEPIFLKKDNLKISCNNFEFISTLCENISKRIGRKFTSDEIEIIKAKQKYEKYKNNVSHIVTDCEFNIKCSVNEIMKLYYEGVGNLTSSGFGKIKILKNGNR